MNQSHLPTQRPSKDYCIREDSPSPPASSNYSSMRLCSTNQRQVCISPRPIVLQGSALKDCHPWIPPFCS
ncbi:hypothetical protein ATANTOWER_012834 [Ataeniobius toweri]|uniref:Uncharacterized protein n=1 Tax=Ataeniobius toweri TaxID=208326 RepID=A0ABU7B6N6_9TELE|nr:hypothetical protein [Ataeniobius toweri]